MTTTFSLSPNPTKPYLLSPAACAALVQNGNLRFRLHAVPAADLVTLSSAATGSRFCVFDGLDANGQVWRLEWVTASTGWAFTARGTLLTSGTLPTARPAAQTRVMGFQANQDLDVVVWCNAALEAATPFGSTAGVRVGVQGMENQGLYVPSTTPGQENWVYLPAPGGPIMSPIVQMAIGSRLDGSLPWPATIDLLTVESDRMEPFPPVLPDEPYFLLLGDSIAWGYPYYSPLFAQQRRDAPWPFPVLVKAKTGATWPDTLKGLDHLDGSKILGCSCGIGINDVELGFSASDILNGCVAASQKFKSIAPQAPFIVPLLTPCAAQLTTPQQAVWQTINGPQGYPSLVGTAIDYLVTGHVAALGDGATPPNLNPKFAAAFVPGTLDLLHLNGAGMRILGDWTIQQGLVPAGLLPAGEP